LNSRKLRAKLSAFDNFSGVICRQRIFQTKVSGGRVRNCDDSLLAGRCPSVCFPLSDFR
jgi:hypothetical protein